jgi:hypothetical protein
MTCRTIEVIVSRTGETRIETRGFAGSGCQEASRYLEQALGIRAAEKLTAEFYHSAVQAQLLHQKGGQG